MIASADPFIFRVDSLYFATTVAKLRYESSFVVVLIAREREKQDEALKDRRQKNGREAFSPTNAGFVEVRREQSRNE